MTIPPRLSRIARSLALAVPCLLLCGFDLEEGAPDAADDAPRIGGVRYEVLDRQANEHTSSTQEAAAIARLANGDHVVCWHSRRQQQSGSYGIYARLYAADGAPRTGEVQVNANTWNDQTRPCVDVAPDGSIWFAWESFAHDGEAGAIVARRFTSDLASATPEVLVNVTAAGHQNGPAIACDDDGALVAWSTTDPVSGARDVGVRRLAADGEHGAELVLDAPEDARDGCVNVVAIDGGFLAVWARTAPDGAPTGLWACLLDPEGAVDGEAFAVAEGNVIEPATTVHRSRGAVAWLEGVEGDYEARWRRFERDANGELELGAIRPLDTGTGGWLSGLDLDLNAAGDLLVVWSRYAEERFRSGTFGRLFDATDAVVAETFDVTRHRDGQQRLWAASGARHVVLGDARDFAVAWNGDAGAGDGSAAAWTLAAPAGELELSTDVGPLASAPRGEFADPALGARPHEPPIRSTGPIDLSQLDLPETGSGFFAIGQTTLTPPDPEIAVGPNHVVCIVNDGIAFFDKAGNQTFSDCTDCPNSGFFGSVVDDVNDLVFDPETLYDPHTGRFFVMYSMREGDGTSDFLVAVSDDSDPNGTWFFYDFDVTSLAGNDIDSPQIAVDDSHVYLTADFFFPVDEHLVFVADKAPMLVGNNPSTASHLISGDQSFGLPITYDAGAPAQYMIESTEFSNNTTVRFWAITDPTNPGSNLQTFTLNVPAYQFPEQPPQQGTTVRPFLFEPRFWSCAYVGGSLWATHHVNSTRVRQRWYEFDMRGWPTSGNTPVLVQSGEIDPGDPIRTFFGSISADADGNALMNVSRSSPSEFISMWTTSRLAGDPLGTTEPLTLAQASTAPDLSGRWGDYSGAKPDPVEKGRFWGHGELQIGAWTTFVEPVQLDVGISVYCTAKTSSAGCVTQIGTSSSTPPTSGANDFAVIANGVQGLKNGILFGGNSGPAALPFSGGTLCVTPPTRRSPVQSSGGSGPVACDGSFSQVVNDGTVFPAGLDAGPGNSGWYQYWYRDPNNGAGTLGTALSNAVRLDFE